MITCGRFTDNLIRNYVQTVESASAAVKRAPDTRGTDYFRGTEFAEDILTIQLGWV